MARVQGGLEPMPDTRRWCMTAFSALLVFLSGLGAAVRTEEPAFPKAALRDSFETPQAVWEREHADTTINLISQDRSVRAAHEGRLSERFEFEADPGSQFYVSYPLPNIPVDETLEVVLHARGNRVGVQLFARVVLPADVDPETRAPSYVLVPGTIYDRVDRWQRLELTHMLPSIERQARVLRASSKRPVSLKGAYIERVIVNLMGGSGASEVFLDDLSISPVSTELLASWSKPVTPPQAEGLAGPVRNRTPKVADRASVILERNRLRRRVKDRREQPWLPTAIDAPGANVTELRRIGFDVLVDDLKADPERTKEAIEREFHLMPRVSAPSAEKGVEGVIDELKQYPFRDSVAFWQIEGRLGRKREFKNREDELERVRKLISGMRGLPPEISHLTTATVDGDLPLFARAPGNLDMVGVQPLLWASAQDPLESFQFLNQRRRLTVRPNAGGLFWSWIPISPPPGVRSNIWGEDAPPAWGNPQVQPEQLRLMTYLALSAGYRGLGFLGNADLTRPVSRATLIEMAFLNEEIDLCESILSRGADPIPVYELHTPDPPDLPPPGSPLGRRVIPKKEAPAVPGLRAAAISVERKGALLLVANYAEHAQYQPNQMAAYNLVLRAILPEGAQAYEISPGEVKVLERVRVPGGTQILLPEFSTTTLVLCTTDQTLAERVQASIARARPMAVQLAIEQAELMFQTATEINGRLAADGQQLLSDEEIKRRADVGITTRPTDARDLLVKAEASIKSARDAQEREDLALAWAEARRASRPLRILMFGHWVKAFVSLAKQANLSPPKPLLAETGTEAGSGKTTIPVLVKPISCPPLVSFNTLPEFYFWLDWIGGKPGYRFGNNRVPSGTFDSPEEMSVAGWVNVNHQLDGIVAKMATVPHEKDEDDRMIRLSVEPRDPAELDTVLPPFLDFPAAAVRSPAIKVQAKNLIRISVLVKRPIASNPGMGGLIVRDSIGGEQFQYRTSDAIASFARVILYRKAPSDGTFTVTLGLAGYGEAYFDDFRVELVEEDIAPEDSPIAQAPRTRPERTPSLPDPSLPATANGAVRSPRRIR